MADREKSNAYQRAWAAANREKVREIKRRHRERHRERIAASRRAHRAENRAKVKAAKDVWAKANPDMVRMQAVRSRLRRMDACANTQLRRNYSITLDQYRSVEAIQNRQCGICGAPESTGRSKRLHVDHDHHSGVVRGLLCGKCNSAIGYFRDDPALLRRAAVYVETHGAVAHVDDWITRAETVAKAMGENHDGRSH